MRLRIVRDNAADRAAIVASTTAGQLTTANLHTEVKAQVWRSTSTGATLTLTWPLAHTVSMFALAFTNLSPTAQFRMTGYSLAGDAEPLVVKDWFDACPPAPLDDWEWGVQPIGESIYSAIGRSYAVGWFDEPVHIQRLVVEIDDPLNEVDYLEASRCICGAHWSPRYGAVYGVQWKVVDSTKPERTEAGDRRAEIGHRHRWIGMDLARLTPEDRSYLMTMILAGGTSRPFFLSLFPQKAEDPMAEQAYQLWCAMADEQALTHPAYMAYSKQLAVEEM